MRPELEDRLRQAFTALASTVDTEDAAPARQRPRRGLMPFAAAAAVVVAGGVIFAVTRPAPPPDPGVSATVAPPTGTPAAKPFPFDLLTHCGVDDAKIGDAYFEAEAPIIGPAHSAPAGWDNPYQHGTMTVLSPSTAIFHDDRGHEVRFRVRPGATAFKHACD